ncbi:PLP-dependent transferase [Auricularia subglabra TFB-10046 SS5]|nr:PLP-dependent transferase [Auricularia subglabra TFB-10046 SS5]
MVFLHPTVRAFQVFGAGTDVGKTLITTALVRLFDRAGQPTSYIKPLSTGPAKDSDELHVRKYALKHAPERAKCLYRLDKPVSPHLAKLLAKGNGPSEWDIFTSLSASLLDIVRQSLEAKGMETVLVETAGGVLSPLQDGTPQAQFYRMFRLPVILVGDHRLGGISNTMSAFETLTARGYDVLAVMMLEDQIYRNHEYLAKAMSGAVALFKAFEAPPARVDDVNADEAAMEAWYDRLHAAPGMAEMEYNLLKVHISHVARTNTLADRARAKLWYPFVQHSHIKETEDITVIDSALLDMFAVYRPGDSVAQSYNVAMFDASASWWTQAVGHARWPLALAAANAASRYGHVLFPKVAHHPAVELAEALLERVGHPWAKRVFYSDNGSTGMEVALKMAMRVAGTGVPADGEAHNWGVIGLRGAYHGDTLGAMNATQKGPFTCEWHVEKGFWFDPPTVGFVDGAPAVRASDGTVLGTFGTLDEVYDLKTRAESDLAGAYKHHIESLLRERALAGQVFGAVVLEPLLLGAGGMRFVDPLFQHQLVLTARALSELLLPQATKPRGNVTIPVVFDEVFTGLGRLGALRADLGVDPDIAVYAKMLTGGVVPLAATLATEDVFNAFLGPGKQDALNHGHSYTANPVACAVANTSLRMIRDALAEPDGLIEESRAAWGSAGVFSVWDRAFVQRVSTFENVDEVMTLGTVLAIRLRDGAVEGYTSDAADAFFDPLRHDDSGGFVVHFRTLGNVAYFMSSLNTHVGILREVEAKILRLYGIAVGPKEGDATPDLGAMPPPEPLPNT